MKDIYETIFKSAIFLTLFFIVLILISGCATVVTVDCVGVKDNEAQITR